MAITNVELITVASNIYVSSGNTVVSVMYFCNTSTTAKNLNLYLLPSGNDTANVAHQIYKDVQIAANDTFVVDMEKLVLANGDQIRANVSANSAVTSTVSFIGI